MVQCVNDRIAAMTAELLSITSVRSEDGAGAAQAFRDQLVALQSSDVGVDAELAFRSALDALLLQGAAAGSGFARSSNKDLIVELLNFAIELGKICESLSFNIAKIPFLLIEDLLQCQTLMNAFLIWDIIESKVDTLTLPVLFNRGKFIILRTCNALLKRLSRSCHTEFCGRVLMFLASVYPLSEKSALNLTGKVNVGNVTHFEDEAMFLAASGAGGEDLEDGSNKVELEEQNSGSEFMEVVETTTTTPLGSGAGESHVDYQLYKAFWEIQGFLTSDPKALDQKSKWPDLMKSAGILLATFEADSSSSSELKQAKRRRQQQKEKAIAAAAIDQSKNDNSSADPRSDYMGCKYLTSSQLFLLELQDPSIRQQLVIQLLITLHYRLKNMAPLATKSTSTSASAAVVNEDDLRALEDRLYKLLQSTASVYGEELTQTLISLFSTNSNPSTVSREDGWLKWKQKSCASFEKEPVSRSELVKQGERKRKRSGGKATKIANGESRESYYFEHEWAEMQAAAKALTQQVPTLAAHIEDFVDAEDPDAGIEDEYHPKHDTIYCWRARRLMADTKLSVFEDMSEGSVAKGLKVLGMIPEPPKVTEEEGKTEENDIADESTDPVEGN